MERRLRKVYLNKSNKNNINKDMNDKLYMKKKTKTKKHTHIHVYLKFQASVCNYDIRKAELFFILQECFASPFFVCVGPGKAML